jgi:hypothetical protein
LCCDAQSVHSARDWIYSLLARKLLITSGLKCVWEYGFALSCRGQEKDTENV